MSCFATPIAGRCCTKIKSHRFGVELRYTEIQRVPSSSLLQPDRLPTASRRELSPGPLYPTVDQSNSPSQLWPSRMLLSRIRQRISRHNDAPNNDNRNN